MRLQFNQHDRWHTSSVYSDVLCCYCARPVRVDARGHALMCGYLFLVWGLARGFGRLLRATTDDVLVITGAKWRDARGGTHWRWRAR